MSGSIAGGALLVGSLLWAACTAGPRVLAAYGSLEAANGLRRLQPHAGVDFAAAAGTPALAPADGEVEAVEFSPAGCGLSVLIHHADFSRYSVLCHLSRLDVRRGAWVRRGQRVGAIGDTGNAGGVPHLHWQLCRVPCARGTSDGALEGTEDPLARYAGCYERGRRYDTHRLVLTAPVACGRESPASPAQRLPPSPP